MMTYKYTTTVKTDGECIVYDRVLDPSEVKLVVDYLDRKWHPSGMGIEVSLEVDHRLKELAMSGDGEGLLYYLKKLKSKFTPTNKCKDYTKGEYND